MLGPQGHSQPGPGMALEQLLKPWDEGLTPACCLSRGRDAWARGSVGFPGNVPALPALRRERRGPECLPPTPPQHNVDLMLQVSGLASQPLTQLVHEFSVWE